MSKSYEEPSGENPNRLATGSLFIIFRKITSRRLEGMFMALGQGENTLPNLFGSYFRKWGQYANWVSRERGRRKRRGVPYGRHRKVAGIGVDIWQIPCFSTVRPLCF
jgi:hypothetical protein